MMPLGDAILLILFSVQVDTNGPIFHLSLQSNKEKLHLFMHNHPKAILQFPYIVTSEPLADCAGPIVHRFSEFSAFH
jgi:hypothetical protein